MEVGVEKVVEALHEDDDNAESDHSACYRGDYPVDGGSETRPTEPDICQFSEFRVGDESRDPWGEEGGSIPEQTTRKSNASHDTRR